MATACQVAGLPTNNSTIYVSLDWEIKGRWTESRYTYKAAAMSSLPSMISPAQGSTLPGSTETFSWTANSAVTEYQFWLGSAAGAQNLGGCAGIATACQVTGLPTNGSTIYALLEWESGGTWAQANYIYKAASLSPLPSMISPVQGSTLPGSTVTFSWTADSAVTQYQLWVGSTAGADNLGLCAVTGTTCRMAGLPTNGSTVYASLDWEIGGTWSQANYTYNAASSTPTLTGLNCTSSTMTAAGTDNCTVTLNTAAASGGLSVSLSSNNSSVTVPASVSVAAGATSASFAAAVSSVSTAQTATLTASANGASKTFALQVGTSVPTLSVSTTNLNFGNDSVNSAATQTVTLTSTGTAAVTASAGTVSGSGFTVSGANFPLTLSPNQTATLTVQFDPAASGAASGTLTLTSNSSTGTSTVVSLSGTGMPVLTGLSCVSASMTAAGTDNCTVTLNAAAASGGMSVNLSSSNSAVTVPASVSVAAGATSASFTATVSSVSTAQTATLTAGTGSSTKTFSLQLGALTPTLSVNATTIAFGNVTLNSPATQTVTLTSTGTTAVTVNAASVTGTGFTVSGASFPLTLNPNQTATLSVQFDPTAAGAARGTLTIVSTSSTNPSDVITLSGTGESATAYEVNLTWDAPTSSTDSITGYNVYRAPSGSTAYQQINAAVVMCTTYNDTSVQTGQTYDYTVESVDASGITSTPSNMASVTTP